MSREVDEENQRSNQPKQVYLGNYNWLIDSIVFVSCRGFISDFTCFVFVERCLFQRAAPAPSPLMPVASTPASAVPPAVTVQTSEREIAALEGTKNSLKELQEEFAVYRREKSENER